MGTTPFLDPESRSAKLIYRLKSKLPASVWQIFTRPYWWWYNRARHQAAAVISSKRRDSRSTIRRMKDIHQGERCFIIGNGPSLQRMDLKVLQDEYTFGMNRIYLLFDKLGFEPSYYVSVNTLVIAQCAQEIRKLRMPKFLTWRAREWFVADPEAIFLDTDYTDPPTFAEDVSGRVFEGSTVTYVALQIAYHMGFSQAILIGVDHNFSAQGRPNETVVSQGKDPDHFSPEYFGKGFRWQLPDLEASERAYRMAAEAYDGAGRQILDATVGGKLKVFPRINFTSLFDPGPD